MRKMFPGNGQITEYRPRLGMAPAWLAPSHQRAETQRRIVKLINGGEPIDEHTLRELRWYVERIGNERKTPADLASGAYLVKWSPSQKPRVSVWDQRQYEWVSQECTWPGHDGPEEIISRTAPKP